MKTRIEMHFTHPNAKEAGIPRAGRVTIDRSSAISTLTREEMVSETY